MAPAPTPYAGLPATVRTILPPRISLTNSQPAVSPHDLLQTFFAQPTGLNPAVPQLPSPTTVESQGGEKVSKSVKGYPDGWRKILNNAKDTVRSGLLLKQPFLESGKARLTVTDAFHEVQSAECENGMVLERGTSTSRFPHFSLATI